MTEYTAKQRGDLPAAKKEWTDKEDMELLDGDIGTLDHGRTCGIWSYGILVFLVFLFVLIFGSLLVDRYLPVHNVTNQS